MNNVEEDRQRAEVFDALGHPTRIIILKALNEGSMGFADLKRTLGIDSSGHLQHHLNKLDGLIKIDEHGKYCLSDQGKDALLTVQTVEKAAGAGPKETERRRTYGAGSRTVLKSIVVLLAILLVASSSVTLLEYNQISQLQTQLNDLREKITSGTNVIWERDLGMNIADFVVADSKVFAMTFGGDLYCFDQQSGRTIWSYSLGGYVTWAPLITVADGKVFTGSRGSVLSCFSENTGTILWKFQPNVTSSIASKSPPEFMVSGGKVLTTGDAFYVLDATTGTLLWDSSSHSGIYRALAFADDRIFAVMAGTPDYTQSLVSLDANTGQQQWAAQIGHDVGSIVVADGRIILWNLYQNLTVFCIDKTSGTLLWQFDVGGAVFQPILSNGLVLFGAGNGNFYALNAEDGSLKWTYNSKQQTANYPATAAPEVFDNKVLVGYEVGHVSALNLEDGQLIWTAPVSANVGSLVNSNRDLYVTSGTYVLGNSVGTNLYKINMDNGDIQWKQTFNYWILPPTYTDNGLYVAADLKVIAYG